MDNLDTWLIVILFISTTVAILAIVLPLYDY